MNILNIGLVHSVRWGSVHVCVGKKVLRSHYPLQQQLLTNELWLPRCSCTICCGFQTAYSCAAAITRV